MADINGAVTHTLGWIGNAVNLTKNDENVIDTAEQAIEDTQSTDFSYNDFDSLQSAFSMGDLARTNWTARDIRNKSVGQEAWEIFKTSHEGAMAGGSAVPGWGHLAGGVTGLIAGGVGSILGNRNARRQAQKLNEAAKQANAMYLSNFANGVQNASTRAFNTAAINLAAYGGMLKDDNIDNYTKSQIRIRAFGGNIVTPYDNKEPFDNGVTKIEEGGSHEENPYSGVMMGVDPSGTPNLVEEGEVVYNDYVYSNRLSPTERQLEEVKLPTKYAGKPYSYIAEKLQEESERSPIDAISKNTLVDNMMKLTTIQEQSREVDQEYEAFAGLENSLDDEEFAKGGKIRIKDSKKGTFTAAAKKRGMSVQAFASKVLANKDKYSPAMVKKANFAKNAAGWKHAFGGNLFAEGGLSDEEEAALQDNLDYLTRNTYLEANYPLLATSSKLPKGRTFSPYTDPDKARLGSQAAANLENQKNAANTTPEFSSDWATTAMRATPVIGSALQSFSDLMGWSNKEDYTNPNLIRRAARQIRNVSSRPIGDYMQYRPMDVDYLANRLQNQNLGLQRGALDMTSGNALAARNTMLVANRNATDQFGDAYRKAREYNDAQRRAVQQFNAGINQFNAQQGLQADVYNQRRDEAIVDATIREAQLRDAIESAASQARSANYTSFLNNAGQWGNDRLYADMAQWYSRYVAPYNNTTNQYNPRRACGGKITRIREFRRS